MGGHQMWKGIVWLIQQFIKRLEYKSRIENKIDTSIQYSKNHERRLLRLEILEAMRRNDRAVVHQLYDEYKKIGGNSYMQEVYKKYIKKGVRL